MIRRRRALLTTLASLAMPLAACAQTQQPSVTAPVGDAPSAAPVAVAPSSSPLAAPAALQDAGGPVSTSDEAGAPAQFRGCQSDADCIAIDRAGCCHNGWKEAVAASQKAAYDRSFTCPQAHPICPMYLVKDSRVAKCDASTHLCTMVKVQP